MRPPGLFEDFIRDGVVKRVSSNKGRAMSILAESERRMHSLAEQTGKIGIRNENANDYVEYCYDIIMHLVRAGMYLEGYSAAGQGAHEAEVSFLRKLGLDEKAVQFANQMRYFRNGILYYGTALDREYAEKVVGFTRELYPRLKELLS